MLEERFDAWRRRVELATLSARILGRVNDDAFCQEEAIRRLDAAQDELRLHRVNEQRLQAIIAKLRLEANYLRAAVDVN